MKTSHTTISRSLIRGILFAAVLCLLFAGSAGAVNLGTFFVYQDVSDFNLEEGEWTSGVNSIMLTNGGIYPMSEFVAGTYERGGNTISVIYPDVKYGAVAKINNADYLIQTGGIVYNGSDLSLHVTSLASSTSIERVILCKPDGTVEHFTSQVIETKITKLGLYEIMVIFSEDNFITGIISSERIAVSKFTFESIDATPSISASADTLYNGEFLTITVKGVPGIEYFLNVDGLEIPGNQLISVNPTETPNQYSFTMSVSATASFIAEVNTNKNFASIELVDAEDGKLEFLITSPVVTAQAEKSYFYIGDDVTILGTSSVAKKFTYSITGYGYDETDLTEYIISQTSGKDWKVTFSTDNFVSENGKKLDPGTYIVNVKDGEEVVASTSVRLSLPFISITENKVNAVQGNTLTISGNADAAESVMYYIFGQDFFKSGAIRTEVTEDGRTYKIEIPITHTQVLGDYIIVVQHPMFDGKFNIYPDGNKIILPPSETEKEIDVFVRSPLYAAEVLCDKLDSQNIDDTYDRGTFTIVSSSTEAVPVITLTLNSGWNFISIPKYLDASCDTAGELLGSLETDGISLLGYDAKTGWYVLKADTRIKPLDGYWVYTKEDTDLPLKYSTAVNTPPSKAVYKGWNAVGLSAEKTMTAKSAFSNLDWVRCLSWDVEQSKWGTVIVNGGSSENSEELKLELGSGNWLYVEADGTYLGNTA